MAGTFWPDRSVGHFLAGTFSKNIWREIFKKYLAGTFKTHIWRENFQKHIWRKHFGGNILRGFFFWKTLQNAPFLNKGSETQP